MRLCTAFLTGCCLCVTLPVFGQRLVEQKSTPAVPLSAVRVQQPVKPAFLITPLVHRLTARRGQLLQFEFEIESNLKPTRLQISTVGMKQQENGVILPDPAVLSPNTVQLLTAPQVDLAEGASHTIRCQLRVPTGNSPFHSFGVLVKELPSAAVNPVNEANQPEVGIRFVTQYLLRADIEVLGVRGDSVKQLEIQSGTLSERNGSALVNVAVNNPTDTAMEFQVRSYLVSKATGKSHLSRLYVPVRANQQEPARYNSRILGNTRLVLDGVLADSVFPGDYTMNVELLYKGRIYERTEFPVEIRSDDFPAQDATIVRVARDIAVEPSSVELSLRKGGNRLQSFTIENGSQQKIVARLTPKPFIGDLAEWIRFRPDVVELGSGQKRKVLVMLGSKRDFTEHSYAFATIEVRPEVGEAIGTQDIPIALLTNSDSAPELKAGEFGWKSNSGPAGFEFPISNHGRRHAELFGRLTMRDQFGRGFVIEDGFGRWVLPGNKDRLWFTFRQPPPPGTYSLKVEIQQGEGFPGMELNQTIKLQAPLTERVSNRGAATESE